MELVSREFLEGSESAWCPYRGRTAAHKKCHAQRFSYFLLGGAMTIRSPGMSCHAPVAFFDNRDSQRHEFFGLGVQSARCHCAAVHGDETCPGIGYQLSKRLGLLVDFLRYVVEVCHGLKRLGCE